MSAFAHFYGLAVVVAAPEHLEAVGRDLRSADRYEAEVLERLTGGGLSVEKRLEHSFSHSNPRYALVRESTGEVLALGGVVPLAEGPAAPGVLPWGSPWMVGTPALDAVPSAAARCLWLILPWLRENFSGLANFILEKAGNGRNSRFLKHLGFTLVSVTFPSTDITVSSEHAGGTVHAAVPANWGLTIFPNQPFTQETDFRNNGVLDAEVLEHCLDKLTLMCLELKERQTRSVQLAEGDVGTPEELRETLLTARETAVNAAVDATVEAAAAAAQRAVVEAKVEEVDEKLAAAELAAEQADACVATSREWAERAAESAAGAGIASPVGRGLVPSGGTAGQVYLTNAAGDAYGWEDFPKVEFATPVETVTGTVTSKAATPAGVKAAVDAAVDAIPAGFPTGGIIMWSGTAVNIPTGWALCNGTNGTPNLVGRFIFGAGGTVTPGTTGGSGKTGATTLTETQMPVHSHNANVNAYGTYAAYKGAASTGGSSFYYTSGAGGSQPHDHDLMPLYYALCFIMKL